MPKITPLKKQLEEFEKVCFSGDESRKILQMYNVCVEQTKKFVTSSGFNDVVIGLSGGIDSSLVAKIAVDALGNSHVHGVILPGPYTSQQSIQDATQLAKNLEINCTTVFINSTCQAVESALKQAGSDVSDLTMQNIQARSRMMMIMALSNQNNWMMLNTGNKSEVYTGYSTLYGDMAGGYAPIGDVYKCDVFKMCIAKNMQEKRMFETDINIIPESIISKPPSAELTDNQTDEDSLGVDYATLDAIIHQFVDNGKTLQEIIFMGFNQQDAQKVVSKIKKSEYKRRYEPPCAKI